MNNNVDLPYPIGTYLIKDEDGIIHVDQVHEYIIGREGVSVILLLDALTDPRLSTKISINYLINDWTEYKKSSDNYSNVKKH